MVDKKKKKSSQLELLLEITIDLDQVSLDKSKKDEIVNLNFKKDIKKWDTWAENDSARMTHMIKTTRDIKLDTINTSLAKTLTQVALIKSIKE